VTARIAQQAYREAGIGPDALDVVEVHDAFAVEELVYCEALGLCEPGLAGKHLASGAFDIGGRVAVSPSGGLLARGHPGGATGLAQIVEAVRQLRGEAGERQQPGARTALTHMIGAGGACVIHILRTDGAGG
jgi:acetyl-CoA acetyltransferase